MLYVINGAVASPCCKWHIGKTFAESGDFFYKTARKKMTPTIPKTHLDGLANHSFRSYYSRIFIGFHRLLSCSNNTHSLTPTTNIGSVNRLFVHIFCVACCCGPSSSQGKPTCWYNVLFKLTDYIIHRSLWSGLDSNEHLCIYENVSMQFLKYSLSSMDRPIYCNKKKYNRWM